jgi:methylthioribulose-1-phosphate dehydratase
LPRQIDALQEIGREFHGRGWSVGSSSNFSTRIATEPGRFMITASGMDKGRLTDSDFVVVDRDCRPVDPEMPAPSAETSLHGAIYEGTDAGAVLHLHSVWGTLLTDLRNEGDGLWIENFEMLKGLAGVKTHEHRQWVEIFENTQEMDGLAQRVAARLADAERPLQHGFLLRRHGLYAWGKNVAEARRHVEVFEFLFEVLVRREGR